MSYVRSSNRGLETSYALIPFCAQRTVERRKRARCRLACLEFFLHPIDSARFITSQSRSWCDQSVKRESLWEGGSVLHHLLSSQLSLRRKPSRPALTVRLRGCPAYRQLKPWSRVWESRGNVTRVILKLNLFAMNTRLFNLYTTAKTGTL